MFELTILSILLLLFFIVAIWYAKYRSKQRSKSFEQTNGSFEYIPEQPEHEFGHLFQQQMSEEHTEPESDVETLDLEPNITLSQTAVKSSNEAGLDTIPSNKKDVVSSVESDVITASVVEPDVREENTDPTLTLTDQQEDGQLIIALTVMAKPEQVFVGAELLRLFANLALEYGDMNIFHKTLQPGRQVLFSVADSMQPGTLEPDQLARKQIKGLVLFMSLPLALNGLAVFDDMLNTATKIADKLNGDLCDEQRHVVNDAQIEQLRSQIFNFNLNLQMNPEQF